MKINLFDRSSYLKGLLILMRSDKKIDQREIEIINQIGAQLDFDQKFIEECVSTLLINTNIDETPPKFTSLTVAENFIKDGFKIAVSDEKMDENEINFLLETAKTNGISEEEFTSLKRTYSQMSMDKFPLSIIEIEHNAF